MLLSVIVPVYNAEKYLHKCIDSLILAAVNNMEIILVNDGSTDNSGIICDEYEQKFSYIKVIHQKNCGVVSARKRGLSASTGKYITFVDSDDYISADMYRKMLTPVNTHNADTVICDIVKESGTLNISLQNQIEEGFYDKERLVKQIYGQMMFNFELGIPAIIPSLCNKIIKREIIENIIFDVDETIVFGEDALCTYPVLLDSESVFILREELYHYTENTSSVTNVYDENLMNKFLLLHDEFERQYTKRDFDFKMQLGGYIARFSLQCIKKDLLYNKKLPVKERIKKVRNYVNDSRIKSAFSFTVKKIKDKKAISKMNMINKNHLFILYLFYTAKEFLTRLKR